MDLKDYQEKAMRTAGAIPDWTEALLSGAICLSGEIGEFCNKIKKFVWHQHDLTRETIVDELGDILWYIAATAARLNISLDELAEYNLQKLQKRYPDGFDPQRSKNRDNT